MQLITYADRLGGDLAGLRSLLDNEFEGLFAGVHVLPHERVELRFVQDVPLRRRHA